MKLYACMTGAAGLALLASLGFASGNQLSKARTVSGVDVTTTPATGQNPAGGGLGPCCPASTDDGGGDWTITQSCDTGTDGANTIACSDGTNTTANAWAR